MDNTIYGNQANSMIGIPINNINWVDISGQPFGLASQFNLFVFGDANNIVDVEGAMAVGGSFYSPRGLSIGFQRNQVPVEFSPDLARFLVGSIVSQKGPLVVIGHAVSGGSFRAALGSTYYIGKNNSNNQPEELKYLYQAKGGSQYWVPSDKGEYYIIPSYDVPRVIPASRIAADLPAFFQNARRSINTFKSCLEGLNVNGTVTSNSYEWILTGSDPVQNIFTIDTRANGLLNKGIRINIPQGSVAIVRLRTGPHAHLQYGLYGEERLANHTLYVFEDATNIHMEKSSDIWGSILAPQAMFHGHPTGGHVSGNAVLGGFAVNANSGFEFHLYPFVGGIQCMNDMPTQELPEINQPSIETPMPEIPIQINIPQEELPIEIPVPIPVQCPEQVPCPTCPVMPPCPVVPSCPTCPVPLPCPVAPPCPEQVSCPTCPIAPPCPTCPEISPCPVAPPCPTCPEAIPCPTCPEERPCPVCPTCPEQQPCPTCPDCPTCPACPTCPEQQPCPTCPICPVCPEQKNCPEMEKEYIAIPIPIPVPIRIEPEAPVCPICEECLIAPGIIAGSIMGCDCCRNHDWDVMLYRIIAGRKRLISCSTMCHLDCFRFDVDYEGSYFLKICPVKNNCFSTICRPKITFQNIGVDNFTLE